MKATLMSTRSLFVGSFVAVALLSGCRGGPDDAALQGLDASSGQGACPVPGKLPFTTQSTTFATPDAKDTVSNNPNPVYDSEDVIGNPGVAQVLTGSIKRASSPLVVQNPVAGEFVSLWARNGANGWKQLGRAATDDSGNFSFDVTSKSGFGEGANSAFTVVEGDATCAIHGVFQWPAGTEVVITDIDGTITLDDAQFTKQVSEDPTYDPLLNKSADEVMKKWGEKGYHVIYLSARPFSLRGPTRAWLHEKGVPFGPLITASSFVFGDSARQYKRTNVSTMKNTFGWKIVAAYGNADSDYQAYEDAGIPKQTTFIVGPRAGESGTVPIANNDFGDHLTNYVAKQPDAVQP
jgi:hypothetical protein